MIRELTLADVAHVAIHMRDSDWAEIHALGFSETREEFAVQVWLQTRPLGYTVLGAHGQPVCVGGFRPLTRACLQVWLIGTDEFERYGGSIWKCAIQRLMPVAFASGARTLRCQVVESNFKAARFCERAGFIYEGLFEQHGRDGEAVMNYRITEAEYAQRWKQPG